MLSINREEELKLLESLPGFISHCCAGSEYFVNKFPKEHRPSKAWLKREIKRRIRANAARFGHEIEQWVIEEIVGWAMECLEGSYRSSLSQFVAALMGHVGSESGLTVIEDMYRPCSGTPASQLAGSTIGSEELSSSCA